MGRAPKSVNTDLARTCYAKVEGRTPSEKLINAVALYNEQCSPYPTISWATLKKHLIGDTSPSQAATVVSSVSDQKPRQEPPRPLKTDVVNYNNVINAGGTIYVMSGDPPVKLRSPEKGEVERWARACLEAEPRLGANALMYWVNHYFYSTVGSEAERKTYRDIHQIVYSMKEFKIEISSC